MKPDNERGHWWTLIWVHSSMHLVYPNDNYYTRCVCVCVCDAMRCTWQCCCINAHVRTHTVVGYDWSYLMEDSEESAQTTGVCSIRHPPRHCLCWFRKNNPPVLHWPGPMEWTTKTSTKGLQHGSSQWAASPRGRVWRIWYVILTRYCVQQDQCLGPWIKKMESPLPLHSNCPLCCFFSRIQRLLDNSRRPRMCARRLQSSHPSNRSAFVVRSGNPRLCNFNLVQWRPFTIWVSRHAASSDQRRTLFARGKESIWLHESCHLGIPTWSYIQSM